MFAHSPWSLRRRSTTMHSSSVSPATKRDAPKRMPCRRTTPCTRLLSAAARIPVAQRRVERRGQACASSHSFTSRSRRSNSVRCPSLGSIRASTPGDARCEPVAVRDGNEAIVVAVEQQHRSVDRGDVEAPRLVEREVVVEPAVDAGREAVSVGLEQIRRRTRPVSTARSAGPSSVSITCNELLGVGREQRGRLGLEVRPQRRLRPRAPCRTRRGSPRPCPSSQSRPSASMGATAARLATATSRSSQSAAQASTCGPPPEMPQLPKRSSESASAIASTSAAQSATRRPACRDEPP